MPQNAFSIPSAFIAFDSCNLHRVNVLLTYLIYMFANAKAIKIGRQLLLLYYDLDTAPLRKLFVFLSISYSGESTVKCYLLSNVKVPIYHSREKFAPFVPFFLSVLQLTDFSVTRNRF